MGLDKHKRPVDRWLDAAIKEHADIEPDSNLDQGILRRLHAQPERTTGWSKWWALSAITTVGLLVAGMLLTRSDQVPKRIAEIPNAPAINGETLISRSSQIMKPRKIANRNSDRRVVHGRRRWPSQFPTPQPLNEQEKLLLRFVQGRPQEARLEAQIKKELSQK